MAFTLAKFFRGGSGDLAELTSDIDELAIWGECDSAHFAVRAGTPRQHSAALRVEGSQAI